MGANLSASYVLTGDIDATATASTVASPGIFGAGGFVPVWSYNTLFTGSLSGAGHIVSGLTIVRPTTDFVGLVGYLGSGGTITGIGLSGGSITGQNSTGGLVANNFGTVSDAYATGAVSGSNNVGGLVGFNAGTVSAAYATGAVSGSDSVGGLVGYNPGMVSNVYATGVVSGVVQLGGLVGLNSGTVRDAYATGAVGGSSYVGGLVGIKLGGTVSNSYWNSQTTGQSASAGGTPLTTDQMQELSKFTINYAGFDFATVWSPPNQVGQNNGSITAYYSQLYALSNVVAITPNATRVYGRANPAFAAGTSYAGLHAGDFVTTLGTFTTTATPGSDVGGYAITGSGTVATGAAGRSYRYVYVPGTLAITPATITVSGASGVNKTYDATTALPGGASGFTYTGVLGADQVNVAAGSTAYDSANAGSRSVLVNGLTLSGTASGNYVLSSASVTGSGTISPATLSYVADAASRTYGAANPALTGTVSGFVGGETQASATTGTLAFASTATSASNVGGYAITGSGLTANNGNYVFVQAAGNATALTINPGAADAPRRAGL